MTLPPPPQQLITFVLLFLRLRIVLSSRALVVTDVRGSSHALIGNPFWSHSKYDKLFFLESLG